MRPTPFLSDRAGADDAKLSRGGHPASLPDIVHAQFAGASAVHDGITPGHCPYAGDRTDRGRFLALMWFRGYSAERDRIRDLTGH